MLDSRKVSADSLNKPNSIENEKHYILLKRVQDYIFKFLTRWPLGHCRIGGRTYSKHTGHSKKLANSVADVNVVPDTMTGGPVFIVVVEVTFDITDEERLFELILLDLIQDI